MVVERLKPIERPYWSALSRLLQSQNLYNDPQPITFERLGLFAKSWQPKLYTYPRLRPEQEDVMRCFYLAEDIANEIKAPIFLYQTVPPSEHSREDVSLKNRIVVTQASISIPDEGEVWFVKVVGPQGTYAIQPLEGKPLTPVDYETFFKENEFSPIVPSTETEQAYIAAMYSREPSVSELS
ncbi:hypothetical protein HZC27_03480 [Candidatus Roizmanbacteria bacterium]|nr:hypothetical protein [Candidatus Roizmanbacteria bacterium]